MNFIILRWFLLTGSILLTSYVIEGIKVSGFFSAFFSAAVLGVLNTLLRPIILFLTLPINIITFGLFTFVINALLLQMASGVIPGFDVYGFWPAVLGSIIITIVNWILNLFTYKDGLGARHNSGVRREIHLRKTDDDRWE